MCQEPHECFLSSYSERRPGHPRVSRYRCVELEECRSGKLAQPLALPSPGGAPAAQGLGRALPASSRRPAGKRSSAEHQPGTSGLGRLHRGLLCGSHQFSLETALLWGKH